MIFKTVKTILLGSVFFCVNSVAQTYVPPSESVVPLPPPPSVTRGHVSLFLGKPRESKAQNQAKKQLSEINADTELLTQNTGPVEYIWTLDDVRQIAEDQNPDLKSAKANYNANSKRIMQAIAGYLPQINITAGFTQTTLPNPGSAAALGLFLPYTSAVATLQETVFDFGKTLNDIGEAQATSHSSEQESIAVHNTVDLAAQQAFYNTLTAERLVDVAKEGVVQFEETLRRTAVRVRTGTRPSFDLSQANVEVAQAKLNLVNAINVRDIAHVTLLNVIGMMKEVNFSLKENDPPKVLPVEKLNIDTLTTRAVDNRPEMKQSEYSFQAAEMTLHSETKQYLPVLAINGFYGQYLPNYPADIETSYGAGITLTWNIFDGLRTTGRVGELAARLDQQSAFMEKERENIVAEVARSFADLKRAQSNLDLAVQNLDFSKENIRLAQSRYAASVATFLELLVAETSLLSAEASEVQARYQYAIALASLKRAVNAPLL